MNLPSVDVDLIHNHTYLANQIVGAIDYVGMGDARVRMIGLHSPGESCSGG